jgi:hypothetical protein
MKVSLKSYLALIVFIVMSIIMLVRISKGAHIKTERNPISTQMMGGNA